MPTYTFYNKRTKETWSEFMSISEMEQFIKKKHIQILPSAPAIVDPIGIGITKPPADFQKHIIGRIKDKVPGAKTSGALERRWSIPKEV